MKGIITILSCLILVLGTTNAQIEERTAELSLGAQNAFITEHLGASKKQVNRYLENAIKEFGKVKRNKKAKEWHCLQCNMPGIIGETNIYFKIDEGKKYTTSYVFYDDGSKFISSKNDPDAAKRIIKSLTDVGFDITRAVISEELKDEENNLKNRNKEQEKLEKKNKNLHDDIAEYQKKIEEAESNIEKNLQEQEDKKMEIKKQEKIVEEVTTRLNNVGKDANEK